MAHKSKKQKGLAFTGYRVNPIAIREPEIDEDEDDVTSLETNDRITPNGRNSRLNRSSPYGEKRTPLQTSSEFSHSSDHSLISSTKTVSTNSNGSMKSLFLILGIVLTISIILILAVVLPLMLTRNPSVPRGTTTTTVPPTVTNAYWAFDQDANDLYGIYNGVLTNSPTFSNSTYFGYGYNLVLNNTLNQSVIVSSPFFNLSSTSFTVEAWIFLQTLTGDNAIFSQCQCSTCQGRCLFLIIRNGRMYMGFTLDDVVGVTSLSTNTWTHVAFVYDLAAQSQSLYLQGVLDNSKFSVGAYQGENGSIVIGSSHLSSSSMNGFIDNLKLTTRAKTAKEVLDAASIVTYHSFDGSAIEQDMGPNQMNGSLSNAAAVTGRVGQALAFTGASSSYLQVYGYFQLGQSHRPFSFSLWIYPYSISGGVLIQKSILSTASGGWCLTLMGLNGAGQIVGIINGANTPTVVGPVVSVRAWTHVGYTYSSTNGLRLYVNGVLFGSTGASLWWSSGTIDWLSFGSFVFGFCGPSVVLGNPFQGAIDELYVFRRELTASEISALAYLS